jgi:DNA-binding IclR family transcriptional regulator
MAQANRRNVQSVRRALSLLTILAEKPNDCSLSDLSQTAHLPASTVHRLLDSMIQMGYVTQNPVTSRYGLGKSLILLSRQALRKQELPQIARPWLEELACETGETVNLTTRLEDSVIQLDHVDSSNMLRVSWNSDERFPLHASASGKVFTAFFPQEERDRILREVERHAFTAATVVDRKRFERELQTIQEQGYALDNGEREAGVRCVAAPIFDADSSVVAAISISGPSSRLSIAKLHQLASSLTRAASKISESLGYLINQKSQKTSK